MPPKKGKKGSNAAPWWWELAVAEGWAIGMKDNRRDKVYAEAVAQLDAVYGGVSAAVVSKYTNWGSAGALTVGGADSLMNKILKVRKLTVKEARMLALQGGLCLSEHLTIMQTMTEHLAAVRGSEQRVVYPEVH